MHRPGSRFALCLVGAATLAALAFPAASSAFQTIRIEGGTLFITGDVGKTPDEVTIRYDSVKNEYVIGHDVDMLVPPPGCTFEGGGPPYKIVHCPAPGITRIRIDLGTDKDKVSLDNMIVKAPAPNFVVRVPDTYLPVDLVSVEIFMGPGNDKFDGTNEVVDDGSLAGSDHIATQIMSMGTDVDTVTMEAGQNTIEMDGSGRVDLAGGINDVDVALGGSRLRITGGLNDVTVGPGNSKAELDAAFNTLVFGPGTSTVTASSGANIVSFGSGNGVFTGGAGVDTVTFGPGNNSFSGGGGDDSVSLGPGKDSASGGPGRDTIRGGKGKDTARGGSGNDRLFGGPGFDSLFGGSGMDACFPGGPGIAFACESP